MSGGVTMEAGHTIPARYTIEHRGNCVLIDGLVPAGAFKALTHLVPESSVMDPDVARMFGVTFAMGPAAELQTLRDSRTEQEVLAQRALRPNLSPGAQRWLAAGERGMSSEALFTRLSGVNCTSDASDGVARVDHPYDPADFRRCRLMLEACPELEARLNDAAGMSKEWAALIQAWGTLCDTLDAECPGWRNPYAGSAPKTYSLIKRAIGR